ncbi:hypothetical protein AB6802_21470 [Mesorhizobium sp. RCC_202]|uniref:hypothetical protein n=1 Tax=Mesorhizobium sp. RCC_202 TaxID=3239222 RepID=UPI003523C1A4
MSHIPGKIELAALSLPSSYLDFLERCGNSQWVCRDELVFLWAGEDIEPFNNEYRVQTLAPGLILIGSDGSTEAFGFDLRSSVGRWFKSRLSA